MNRNDIEIMIIEIIRMSIKNLTREQRAKFLDSTFINWQEMNTDNWHISIEYAVKIDKTWIQFTL